MSLSLDKSPSIVVISPLNVNTNCCDLWLYVFETIEALNVLFSNFIGCLSLVV